MRPILFARSAVTMLAALFVLAGCESKITVENYDKVNTGMTLAEVEAVLGKGELQEHTGTSISSAGIGGGAAASSQKTYTWHEPRKEIAVTFGADGKVVGKNKSGL